MASRARRPLPPSAAPRRGPISRCCRGLQRCRRAPRRGLSAARRRPPACRRRSRRGPGAGPWRAAAPPRASRAGRRRWGRRRRPRRSRRAAADGGARSTPGPANWPSSTPQVRAAAAARSAPWGRPGGRTSGSPWALGVWHIAGRLPSGPAPLGRVLGGQGAQEEWGMGTWLGPAGSGPALLGPGEAAKGCRRWEAACRRPCGRQLPALIAAWAELVSAAA